VRVFQTVREPSASTRRDDSSPTGWVSRTGDEHYLDELDQLRTRAVWEPTDAPRIWLADDPEAPTDGVVETVVDDVQDVQAGEVSLTADEVRYLVRRYAQQYADGLLIASGVWINGSDATPRDAMAMAVAARANALRFGIDLAATNVGARGVDRRLVEKLFGAHEVIRPEHVAHGNGSGLLEV
jgi:hypothetical protein